MSSTVHAELLILGCGPAGYAAAVHAARANLQPLLVTGVAKTAAMAESNVSPEAWPTDIDLIDGPELKQRLRDHAERASTRVVFDCIRTVGLSRRPFELDGQAGSYTCDALIVAVDRPSTGIGMFEGQLEIFKGRIVTRLGLSGMATLTSRRGVFVAGDVGGEEFAELVTSTGTGCMAALDARRFLGH